MDYHFEDDCTFVQTLDEDEKFIPIDRIQVVSKSRSYGDGHYHVTVRYQDGEEYPTAVVDEEILLMKVADAKDQIMPAVAGTYCVRYRPAEDVLHRWPVVAWRIGKKYKQPRPIMLDPIWFDPNVTNFIILFPDGIVFRTGDEKWWDNLMEYKKSEIEEAMKAAAE
jgi:hypothetical protein